MVFQNPGNYSLALYLFANLIDRHVFFNIHFFLLINELLFLYSFTILFCDLNVYICLSLFLPVTGLINLCGFFFYYVKNMTNLREKAGVGVGGERLSGELICISA